MEKNSAMILDVTDRYFEGKSMEGGNIEGERKRR
jgi:hypothetical protein